MKELEVLIDRQKIAFIPKSIPLLLDAVAITLSSFRGKRVGLYGCGELARKLMEGPSRPDPTTTFFITSFPGEPPFFHEYERIHVAALPTKEPDVVLLLSLEYESEMRSNTATFIDTDKVLALSDIMVRALEVPDFRRAVEALLKEAFQRQKRKLEGRLNDPAFCSPAHEPILCFVAEYLTFAYLKRLEYLKSNGFKVIVLVASREVNGSIDIKNFIGQGYFDAHQIVEDFFILLPMLIEAFPFSVLYLFPSTSKLAVFAEIILRKKCPVIVDYWDVKEILLDDFSQLCPDPLQRQTEQLSSRVLFCLSDGIILKDAPEIMDRLVEKYGYQPQWLHFPSFVSLPNIRDRKPAGKLKQTGTYRIVYVGNLQNDPRSHAYPVHSTILNAARKVTAQGLSFDIFNASDYDGSGFQEYLDLAKHTPLFNYHFALPPQELCNRLTDYDFGWFCFDFSRGSESKFFNATTFGSKLSTYLEAGLPVLVSPEQEYFLRFVEAQGIGLGVSFLDLENLKAILDALDYETLSLQVARFRFEWSMENNVSRLTSFLHEVIENSAVIRRTETLLHA